MHLKKTLSTGQIQTMPTHSVSADLAHRLNADQTAARRTLWRLHMGHVRRQNEWCRINGERHAHTEPIRPIGRPSRLATGSSCRACAPTSTQPAPGEPDNHTDEHQEQNEPQPRSRVVCLSVGSQSNARRRIRWYIIFYTRFLFHSCKPRIQFC